MFLTGSIIRPATRIGLNIQADYLAHDTHSVNNIEYTGSEVISNPEPPSDL